MSAEPASTTRALCGTSAELSASCGASRETQENHRWSVEPSKTRARYRRVASTLRRGRNKYYKIERRNRKMALELEAIGAFLGPLPEEDKQKFRHTIGDRSFGRDDE